MDIDGIARTLNEDPDDYNETYEDMATRLRRFLVRNHGMEEYDIHVNTTSENTVHGDSDQEVWKIRHNAHYKPFTLAVRRDVLGRTETGLMLQNVKDFLTPHKWKVTDSKLTAHDFEITISPK